MGVRYNQDKNGLKKVKPDEEFKKIHATKKKARDKKFTESAKFDNVIERWVKSIYTTTQACKFMEMSNVTLMKKLKDPSKLTIAELTRLSLMIMVDPHLVFTACIGMKSEYYDQEEVRRVAIAFRKVWIEQRKYLREKKSAKGFFYDDFDDEDDNFDEIDVNDNPIK